MFKIWSVRKKKKKATINVSTSTLVPELVSRVQEGCSIEIALKWWVKSLALVLVKSLALTFVKSLNTSMFSAVLNQSKSGCLYLLDITFPFIQISNILQHIVIAQLSMQNLKLCVMLNKYIWTSQMDQTYCSTSRISKTSDLWQQRSLCLVVLWFCRLFVKDSILHILLLFLSQAVMAGPCVGLSKIGLVACTSISSASGRTLLPSGTQVLMGLLTQSHTYESMNIQPIWKTSWKYISDWPRCIWGDPSPPAAKWDTVIGGEGEWGVNDEYVYTDSDIFITSVNRLILLHKHFHRGRVLPSLPIEL